MVEKFGFKAGDFPVCEYVAARTLALPFFGSMTRTQVDQVCKTLDMILERTLTGKKGKVLRELRIADFEGDHLEVGRSFAQLFSEFRRRFFIH